MSVPAHPADVLLAGSRPLPALAVCEHFAGSEKTIRKSLALQAQHVCHGRPLFDVTADCEDGAALDDPLAHAERVAALVDSDENRYDRVGVRLLDVRHPVWRAVLERLIARAGQRIAYVVLPKAESLSDVESFLAALADVRHRHAQSRPIPLHVLIETPGALHDVWRIAALEEVETLDFGLMDFVSAHQGAIPESAMHSPAQFSHPLIVRAKCEIAAAALAHGKIPSHNVTTALDDPPLVTADARRAREEFGFLRMWSIHPNQILPIVEGMRPPAADIAASARIITAAAAAAWGPLRLDGRLHDRASYRYHWQLLQRAHAAGATLPDAVAGFFSPSATV